MIRTNEIEGVWTKRVWRVLVWCFNSCFITEAMLSCVIKQEESALAEAIKT